MITIKDKIIAFRKGGELLIFESREEFEEIDIKKDRIAYFFATPSDLYRHLVELEDKEEFVREGKNARKLDPWWKEEADFLSVDELQAEQAGDEEADRKDYEKQIEEAVEEGEFSDATIRGIREREEKRQRRLLEDAEG